MGVPDEAAAPTAPGGFGGLTTDSSAVHQRSSTAAAGPSGTQQAGAPSSDSGEMNDSEKNRRPKGPVQWLKEATKLPLSHSSTNVNLTSTLPFMEGRKSLRRYRGAYQKTRPVLAWFMFLLLFAIWTLQTMGWTGTSVTLSFELQVLPSGMERGQILYGILLVLVLIYMLISIRLMTTYNLAFGWVITAIFVILSIVGVLLSSSQPSYNDLRNMLLSSFLVVQGMYLVICWLLRHVLPYAQMKGYFLVKIVLLEEYTEEDSKWLETIPQNPAERAIPSSGTTATSTFNYVQVLVPIMRIFICNKDKITYSGEVDAEGRPHGYGCWTDSHWHGEALEGWWEHGIPLGPFQARETGSGSGFVNMRMAYIMCRDDKVQNASFFPRHAPLKIGVVSAECSVSGYFFKDYPLIRFFSDPVAPSAVATTLEDVPSGEEQPPDDHIQHLRAGLDWMLAQLISIKARSRGHHDSVVITADMQHGLRAGGFHEMDEGPLGPGSVETISIRALKAEPDQGTSSGSDIPEKSKATKSTSMKLPPFGTPRARSHSPFSGALTLEGWRSCYEPDHREAILYIHGYNSPVEWGMKNFGQLLALGNFPSYLKPFVFSWPTGQLFAVLAAKRSAASMDTVESFVDTLRGMSAAGFQRVHILTHSMGARILLSAIPQILGLITAKQTTAGPPTSVGGPAASRSSASLIGSLSISTITMLNPDFGLTNFLRSCAKSLRTISPVVTIYGDLKDTALFGAELWNSMDATFFQGHAPSRSTPVAEGELPTHTDGIEGDNNCCCGALVYERSLGKNLYSIKGPFGEPFDIDVVDTTFLEANVHDVRHNAFSLNRDIIEDLREIMTTYRRASNRSRLEPRGGNVYSFMVAPAYVVQPS